MHPWNLSAAEAEMLQESLAEDCVLDGDPEVETVAALDVSIQRDSRLGFASAILYSVPDRTCLDRVVLIDDLTFPYIPGLLAFREAPMMLSATVRLEGEPDCLLVDGHGYAHPRRFGLASHMGLLLELPSIGCAKENLVGEYDPPAPEPGSHTDIWEGEPLGYAYRSMEGANPVFLSPGHLIDRRNILDVVKPLFDGKRRLPVPLHRADREASRQRKRFYSLTRPFLEEGTGEVFVVGGALRDLLMGNAPEDYDLLVTRFADSTRRTLEESFDARWFTLDEERSIHRLPGDSFQIDLKVIDEEEVVDDLLRRDFTVNSIGLDMNKESWIDPADGRRDIQKNLLRPTGETSLRDDPLRVLRSYRLAQYHDLEISSGLVESIQQHGGLLENVAKERVVEELLLLVSGSEPGSWLHTMKEHGLLSSVGFFRMEGPEELRRLSGWETALRDRSTWHGKTYHGDFSLYQGFAAARLITRDVLSDWPFHRNIRTATRESHRPLPERPDTDELMLPPLRLHGRTLGRALRDGWESTRLGEHLRKLERYLSERKRVEKTIVEEMEGEKRIGERKEEKLRRQLPELWDRVMG